MSARPAIKIPVYLATLAALLLVTYFLLNDTSKKPATQVKLMTFNIRFDNPGDSINAWPQRMDMVTGIMQDYPCDFIGLQEVLPNQMQDISERLPQYKAIFRTREISPEGGESSPILYDHGRWLLLSSGTFWLSDTHYEPGSNTWEAACNRIATWGRFRNMEDKKTIFVLNTHFDHVSQKARENSIQLILEKIFFLSEGSPVVFLGDLNVEEDNPVYDITIHEGNFSDAYRAVHPEASDRDRTFNGWQPGEGISRIDYIFTSSEFTIKNARVIKTMLLNRYPSDHFPVMVEGEF